MAEPNLKKIRNTRLRKLKRILKSSGENAARAYAEKHGLEFNR